MNAWGIVKAVGSGVISSVVPGGGAILKIINSFLPDEKKLPYNATGDDVGAAIHSLPPEARASLLEKQFDVDITQIKESHNTARVMLEMEAKSTHSTRPKIAYQAFQVVSAISLMIVFGWMYAISTGKPMLVKSITDGWPFVAAIILPFVGWLNRYFGILKSEHKNRLDAAGGNITQEGIAGIISAALKR